MALTPEEIYLFDKLITMMPKEAALGLFADTIKVASPYGNAAFISGGGDGGAGKPMITIDPAGGGGSAGGSSSFVNANYAIYGKGAFIAIFDDPMMEDRMADVPSGGVKVGEIIGWRCWRVCMESMRLASCIAHSVWDPGEPMTGDPRHQGVHAWKTERDALRYADGGVNMVFGPVALWGDVVEHERGFRASFARPLWLDIHPRHQDNPAAKEALQRLFKIYGLTEMPEFMRPKDKPHPEVVPASDRLRRLRFWK